MGVITIIRKSRDKEKVGARVRNDEWELPKRMKGSAAKGSTAAPFARAS